MSAPIEVSNCLRLEVAGRPLAGPAMMGVVNVTPDSFSDGGRWLSASAAAQHAEELVHAGASLLDIGAESTRPGSLPVSMQQELSRLLPALDAIMATGLNVPISVDTRRPEVARQALARGVQIINDVSPETDPAMARLVRDSGCTLVLMHGYPAAPEGAQALAPVEPAYAGQVHRSLVDRATALEQLGIKPRQLWLDPGLGFGKAAAQSFAVLANLAPLATAGYAVLVGPSRKRFLTMNGPGDIAVRDGLTATACALAVAQGVSVVRVHAPHVVGPHVQLAARVRGVYASAPSLATHQSR